MRLPVAPKGVFIGNGSTTIPNLVKTVPLTSSCTVSVGAMVPTTMTGIIMSAVHMIPSVARITVLMAITGKRSGTSVKTDVGHQLVNTGRMVNVKIVPMPMMDPILCLPVVLVKTLHMNGTTMSINVAIQ